MLMKKCQLVLMHVYKAHTSLILSFFRDAYHALKAQWHQVPEVIESVDFCEQKHRIGKQIK
jgi:hypothetical protein